MFDINDKTKKCQLSPWRSLGYTPPVPLSMGSKRGQPPKVILSICIGREKGW